MRQEAIDLQHNAVSRLVELTTTKKDEMFFKAPTGSGKTYMMADMMNRILSADKDVIFVVSTLSKGDLASQNYEKFVEYSAKGAFGELKPYLISSEVAGEERLFVPTEYTVYLLPRDLYKKGGRLMQGAMEGFLHNITSGRMLGGKEKKIYLIKDECHIATNNLDNLGEKFFSKIYNFSATPKLSRGQHPDVEIKNDDAVNAKLIKDIELMDDPNAKVTDAIEKFETVKKDYRNLLGVNPCLIIQISNKDKADAEIAEIKKVLEKAEHVDIKWMLIVNDDKECDTNDTFKAKKLPVSKWKEYAKGSNIDIIIFKMVITEGWDIPRACMLYQMRDSQSKQLDEQVMGRVRRNPRLLDFDALSEDAQKLAMTAWIWGIIPEDLRKSYGVKLYSDSSTITDEIKIKTTRLKNLTKKADFKLEEFLTTQPVVSAPSSIFSLWRDFTKAESGVREMAQKYATDFTRWREFTENIESVASESKHYINDYTKSMEVVRDESGKDIEVSFAPASHYADNGNYVDIGDWVWKRSDGKGEKFAFDSEAERQWTSILKDLSKEDNNAVPSTRVTQRVVVGKKNPRGGADGLFGEKEPEILDAKQVYLWGKNYVANSSIKFEYYLGALRSSYPDFVMKDSFGRIHIFEVKSVNISSSMAGGFDNNLYKTKLEELKKAYKQSSILTGQIFYLPILKDDNWRIFQYISGDEKILSKDEFVHFCKNT